MKGNETTKKNLAVKLFTAGVHDIDRIAARIGARASYVAQALQNAGLIAGYFDLYTTSGKDMNVYSPLFSGKLGFRDRAAAKRSVELLDYWYDRFEKSGDKAGQHHALNLALVMFNRARWSKKPFEAAVFREWLLPKLTVEENVAEKLAS